MKTKVIRMATMVVLLVISLILPVQAGPPRQGPPPGPPGPTGEALVGQLQQETGGKVRVSYHTETGKVRFIGTSPDRPIAQPAILAAGAPPEAAARGFLATYGHLFGLKDQAQELKAIRERSADGGRSFVRFQQVYQGIPVLGGELVVQVDASRNIVSANGEILPDLALHTVPGIDAETARLRALATVAKDYGLSVDDLTVTEPELWIYNPILLGGLGPRLTTLVWRMDVEPRELLPIRELVLMDAHLGAVALHFNQIDAARNRLTYDANNGTTLPGTLRCNESNPTCTGGDAHEVAAHRYAGATYDFYFNQHGRDSLNNAGMTLVSTVHYGSSYANAFWNGSQMVYGDAYGFPLAEDVVAHEMTHGVTEYESKLFYYMQSGAINESFSDIWGEFVDLAQVTDNDAGDTRWAIGEDVSGMGAIRNMQNPTLYGDPDRMTSSHYYCGEDDRGGVHSNSGVANKAAYLMVDGATFNGYTVTGIGITKTAKIFYEVQTNLFTSAADYQDLYDDLYQACTNLIGTSGITAADCQEVRDASDATQMNQQPTSCPATHAPVCASGSPTNLFFDNMENTGSGNWTSAAIVGSNRWYYPQTANPYGFDATYATSGVYNIWGYDQPGRSDFYIRMTSDVALPAGSQPYLRFNHAYAFEDSGTTRYDGGVLEYSTNGGSSWNDAGSLFTHNGYKGTIASGYSNPLQGRQAFVGESNGYISSRLNLSSLAGQSVRFRFRIGTDSYELSDALGWFIDDVRVYTCGGCSTPPAPSLSSPSNGSTTGDNTPTFSWGSASGATSYRIQVDNNSSFSSPEINQTTSSTSYTPGSALPDGTYYWRVRASNACGTGPWSAAWQFTITSGPSTWNILFDETHGYASDTSGSFIIEDQLSDLAALLTDAGATVASLTPPAAFNYATISQYDVLALVLPQTSYTAQERTDINTFVQNGGRLVVVGDWGGWTPADIARPILNQVLSSLGTGIALNADTVHDPTDNEGPTYWPIIHQFSTDPVNEGVGQVVEYAASSLNVSSPGYATAWGDDDSYTGFTAMSVAERDDAGLLPDSTGIGHGPNQQDDILIDYSTTSSDPIPVMAMADLSSGDIFVVGDVSLWTNSDADWDGTDNLSEYNNTQLALNVFLGTDAGGKVFLPIILRNH